MLEGLGIDPRLERVYRQLLARPGSATANLAEGLSVPRADVEVALDALIGLGLVLRSPKQTYVAAPPAVAIGALITERRDGLRMAEQALAGLDEEHRLAAAGLGIDALIEVVTGTDAIRQRYLQVQRAATTQLRTFVTAPFVAVAPGQNPAERSATDRGVRYRTVLERATLEHVGIIEEIVDSLQQGMEIRVAETLPLKLVLADADLALVPLSAGATDKPGAVLLQRSGLLAALDALFESVWAAAHPLELTDTRHDGIVEDVEDPEGLTAIDRQIVNLLLAGLSDQAVATQLGLSLRTIQRRLRFLQDLAGVQTRMQLGWHIARNDWDLTSRR